MFELLALFRFRYIDGGKPNFGTAVGRCANRIANGSFEIDGQKYQLDQNNGVHHLHGGTEGFYKQVMAPAGGHETAGAMQSS